MAPSYPDHGGLSSGEDALMAVTAEVAKGPHLSSIDVASWRRRRSCAALWLLLLRAGEAKEGEEE